MSAIKTTLLDTIKVLESCEAKLEYLGLIFTGPLSPDRHRDGPDCLNRAHKARNAIATLRATLDEHYAAVGRNEQEKP